jgi:hypothetical protein
MSNRLIKEILRAIHEFGMEYAQAEYGVEVVQEAYEEASF